MLKSADDAFTCLGRQKCFAAGDEQPLQQRRRSAAFCLAAGRALMQGENFPARPCCPGKVCLLQKSTFFAELCLLQKNLSAAGECFFVNPRCLWRSPICHKGVFFFAKLPCLWPANVFGAVMVPKRPFSGSGFLRYTGRAGIAFCRRAERRFSPSCAAAEAERKRQAPAVRL